MLYVTYYIYINKLEHYPNNCQYSEPKSAIFVVD